MTSALQLLRDSNPGKQMASRPSTGNDNGKLSGHGC